MNQNKSKFGMPEYFTMEQGVKVIKILPSDRRSSWRNLSGGRLYILGDMAGPVPIYIEDCDVGRNAASSYTPYFGNFKEGVLTRGLIFAGYELDPRPGVFVQLKKESLSISICSGSGQTASPFTQKVFSFIGNEEGLINPEYSYSILIANTKLGPFSGTFIPFSHTSKIQCFKNGVLDYFMKYVLSLHGEHQATSYSLFLELLAEFAKQVDLAEVKYLAKKAGETVMRPLKVKKVLCVPATDIDSSSPSDMPRFRKKSVSAHTSAEVDSLMTNDDGAAAVEAMDDENPAFEPAMPAYEAAPVDDDIEDSSSVDPFRVLSTAAPDDDDDTLAPEAAAETPLTNEQIHQKLYADVMATVPEGRIHQRVLDRLIDEWLSMTKIPLEQLQIFGSGSHRKIHVAGGGVTTVKRHGRSDRTYAPGEARRLAERVVGLSAPK
jgi:hypothetical protein